MKPKHFSILAFNFLISLVLAIIIVILFSKEQEEEGIIQNLQAQKQLEEQKAIKAQKETEAQKQIEAQIKLEAQKQVEAGKIRKINEDLDKIDARLQRVLDEPSGYADETKGQRDTQEELLKQLANCAKTEIGFLAAEMQDAGFKNNAALQENLSRFFRNYETKIHDEHLSYDWTDLGYKDSDHKKELDSDSIKSLQATFNARRAIRNLKPKPAE